MRLVRWVISGLLLGALGGFVSGLLRQRTALATCGPVAAAPASSGQDSDSSRTAAAASPDGLAASCRR